MGTKIYYGFRHITSSIAPYGPTGRCPTKHMMAGVPQPNDVARNKTKKKGCHTMENGNGMRWMSPWSPSSLSLSLGPIYRIVWAIVQNGPLSPTRCTTGNYRSSFVLCVHAMARFGSRGMAQQHTASQQTKL